MHKIIESTKFQLARALSVRLSKDSSQIQIGSLPPAALIINKPPSYLARMLELLSTPHTLHELLEKLELESPEFHHEEIKEVFNELLDTKVIQACFYEGRYHRHQLYFNFFDVQPEEYQKTLSTKKVGLIGSGGVGSTCALLLATAGIGTLVLLDNDSVEESNLTRTILFEESDINAKKVVAAKKRLEARNRYTTIVPVVEECLSAESIKEHLSDCDVWLLSADTPPGEIHQWTSEASLSLGIPYISAGYVEIFGLVGPFFLPNMTSCHNSFLTNTENNNQTAYLELNRNFQAPSYGPLNALVSSIAVNEILRYLLGLDMKTLEHQLLINSIDYEIRCIPA